MSSGVAQVGRSFATLGMAEVGARVIAFLVTAWVSQQVGAAGFGVISFALAALLYAHRLASWELEAVGVSEVVSREAAASQRVRTLLVSRFVSAVTVALLVFGISRLALPREDATVLTLYSIGLCFVALNARFVYLMRQEPARPALARLLTEGTAAVVLLLTVRTPADLYWVPVGYLVGEALAAILLWSGLRFDGEPPPFRYDRALARRTAGAAWPLVLSSLLGLLAFNFDLILLRFTQGATTAGYYAAAYALVSLLLNLGVTFYANVLPGLSRVRDDRGAFATLHADASVLVVTLFLPVVVGGALLAKPLVQLVFGQEFAPSAGPLVPLFVSAGLTVARFVPLATVVALGSRRQALWINGSGAVVSMGLNLWLIPRFGMMGAASAAVVTDVVRLAVALVLCARAGVPFGYLTRHWRAVLAAGAMALLVWMLRDRSLFMSVPLGGVAYAGILLAVGGLRIDRALRPRLMS